jgi:hypothetical protein
VPPSTCTTPMNASSRVTMRAFLINIDRLLAFFSCQ